MILPGLKVSDALLTSWKQRKNRAPVRLMVMEARRRVKSGSANWTCPLLGPSFYENRCAKPANLTGMGMLFSAAAEAEHWQGAAAGAKQQQEQSISMAMQESNTL